VARESADPLNQCTELVEEVFGKADDAGCQVAHHFGRPLVNTGIPVVAFAYAFDVVELPLYLGQALDLAKIELIERELRFGGPQTAHVRERSAAFLRPSRVHGHVEEPFKCFEILRPEADRAFEVGESNLPLLLFRVGGREPIKCLEGEATAVAGDTKKLRC